MPSRPMITAAMPPSTLSTTFLSVSANKGTPRPLTLLQVRARAPVCGGQLPRRAGEIARGGLCAAVDRGVLEDVAGVAGADRAGDRAHPDVVDDAVVAHRHRVLEGQGLDA